MFRVLNHHTIIRAAFVCVFVPYLLRDPLMDLHQTWWLYVGGPPNCPWGVLFRKGQRVDGSMGRFHFHYIIYDSRRRHTTAKSTRRLLLARRVHFLVALKVTDVRVVRAGISVTWNVLSWSGGHEFKPQSGRTWSAQYFCPKSYLNQKYKKKTKTELGWQKCCQLIISNSPWDYVHWPPP